MAAIEASWILAFLFQLGERRQPVEQGPRQHPALPIYRPLTCARRRCGPRIGSVVTLLSLVHSSTWPDDWRAYVAARPVTTDHALDRLDLALAHALDCDSGLRPLAAELRDVRDSLEAGQPDAMLAAALVGLAARAAEHATGAADDDAAAMLAAVADALARPRAI